MFLSDDEKDGKEKALEKLKDLMMGEMGNRMGGMKKPMAASMTIEKLPGKDDDMDDMSNDDDNDMPSDNDGDEISDEDKDKIRELYNKFC